MKTKLTLTVRKSVIDTAKRLARHRNVSLSRLFEETFGQKESPTIKTESQRAGERLLKHLLQSKSVETLDDKYLLKTHVKRKFA